MKNIIKFTLISTFAISLFAQEEIDNSHRNRLHSVREAVGNVVKQKEKEIDVVDGIKHMFEDGVVSGQIRSMYSSYDFANSDNIYATAIGGQLKYELAEYKGFSGGVAFSTSHEIGLISGNGVNFNSELTSADGSYTELSEAYLKYKYKNLSVKLGRQLIDTPLADSDDIRMSYNTFEAYIVSYDFNNIKIMGGLLKEFQGYDAGLDVNNPWQKTGGDGTYLISISYATDYLEACTWYYDISEDTDVNSLIGNVANQSTYISLGGHYHFTKNMFLHTVAQYLNQRESKNSGIKSNVYGIMTELVIGSIGFNFVYNISLEEEGKQVFSGFGAGTMFTSMDNMILENIAVDREVKAIVSGVSYSIDKFNMLYAYGDFDGKANSNNITEHITEHNLAFEYVASNEMTIASIYTNQKDKDNTGSNGGDWDNFRILVSYSF